MAKYNKSFLNNALKNKYVLYIVALIAFFILLGQIMMKQFSAVLLFYLTGLVAYYFTKNMTIVLGVSILSVSFAGLFKNLFGLTEGFKEGNSDSDNSGTDSHNTQNVVSNNDNQGVDSNDDDSGSPDISLNYPATSDATDAFTNKSKSGKAGKSGYSNLKLNPGLYNMPNKDQVNKQLGKVDKIEAAYDNLEKVVGTNGIRSMSSETQNLVKQQGEMLKQLKEITPMLNDAMGAVSKLDMSKIAGIFNDIKGNLPQQ
jgi:hypothetical protein